MALRYKCKVCGQWHEGLPALGFVEPYVGVEESKKLSTDLCVIDGRSFFVRCLIQLPISGAEESFSYGIWSSLSEANFTRYEEHYDEDLSSWLPMFGYLSNELPGYTNTFGLKLSVQTGTKGVRPIAALEPTGHPLSVDQREGISIERAIELAEFGLHGDE